MRKKAGRSSIHLLGIFIELPWQLLFLGALGITLDFEVSEWVSTSTVCNIRGKKIPKSIRIEVADYIFPMLLDRAVARSRFLSEVVSTSLVFYFCHW